MKPLSVAATILYNGTNISSDVSPYLKSLSCRDVLSGRADDLDITLEDRTGLWQSGWFPDKGATLDVTLTTSGSSRTLRLGTFEIDEITSSGYPSEVTIKAISVPGSTTLRWEEHTRSWEKAKLQEIANDIAAKAELELFYDTSENPTIDRAEQTEQSDLSFLAALCLDYGLALKVSDGKLIIFDEQKYEEEDAAVVIVKPGTDYTAEDGMLYITGIKNYSFKSKIYDVYAACHVAYSEGKTIEATFTVPGKTGKTLQVKEQAQTTADAERLAKKRLREKNREEVTGSFALPWSFSLAAGMTVMVLGYGAFDGKYLITQAEHSLGGGYNTSIQIRRCLDGY